ncbi:MAG: PIN domain-containing protein [Acidobacteriaceae bacterium]|nr:PIN domain-containing protein [Acidobacteriaceae bacterium]
MLEIVLDTNVLVSAFRSSRGSSYRLLQSVEKKRWRPVISPTLAFEYEAVLKRGTGQAGPSLEDIDDLSNTFAAVRGWYRYISAGGQFCQIRTMIVFWKWRFARGLPW